MKRLFLLIVLFCIMLFCIGCEDPETGVEDRDVGNGQQKMLCLKGRADRYDVNPFVFDGCEYIAFGGGSNLNIVHSGNCKQCSRRLEELVKKHVGTPNSH